MCISIISCTCVVSVCVCVCVHVCTCFHCGNCVPCAEVIIGLDKSDYHTSEDIGSVFVCAELLDLAGNLETSLRVLLSTTDGTAIGKMR